MPGEHLCCGRVDGLRAGTAHVGQSQVLGVGLPQAAGRALPQGARLLEEPWNWGTGAGPHLAAERMNQWFMCPFHHGV